MKTRINSRTVLARLRQSSFFIDKKVYYPSNKVNKGLILKEMHLRKTKKEKVHSINTNKNIN